MKAELSVAMKAVQKVEKLGWKMVVQSVEYWAFRSAAKLVA